MYPNRFARQLAQQLAKTKVPFFLTKVRPIVLYDVHIIDYAVQQLDSTLK